MKKLVSILLAFTMVLSLAACQTQTQPPSNSGAPGSASNDAPQNTSDTDFPSKDLNGWITYGAGGGTDSASRALAGDMGKFLGKTIVMDNMTGASGAVAAQFVLNQPSDGYNLLFGSEGIHSFQFMDIADIGIDSLKTVFISCFTVGTLVVPADSPYNTYQDFVDAALASPGTLRLGNTNISGIPYIVSTMMNSVHGTEFNDVYYDSDNDAMTALLGGHIDAFICYHPTAVSYVSSGDVKALMLFHNEAVGSLPDVPYITQSYPEFDQFLPYGPYFGVWVSKDTPDEIVAALAEAAAQSNETDSIQSYLTTGGAVGLALTGEEAEEFMTGMQSTMAYLLYDTGAIEKDPAQFGIQRNSK